MQRDAHIQFESAAAIKHFQEVQLAATLHYLQARSPFYRNMFKREHIDISKIRTLEDLQYLPVTTKDDMQRQNADFICVERRQIIDYVTTSGTLGDPVTFALTASDLDRLAYNEWLSFQTVGLTPDDVMQLMVTIDRRFMAGLAYYMGACRMGMGVVRVGNGIPELQFDTMRRIKPTCGMCVPSFLVKLIDYAHTNDINLSQNPMKRCICIGEALCNETFEPNTLAAKISHDWPSLQLFSTYASTEMQTSFTECAYRHGGHVPPDLIIMEFLDGNNCPVPAGESGEVTVTTLGVEGMPLLRFKIGDLCYHYDEPCACGRQTIRLSPIIGRKGQMIKFKGTTLYPPALYDILDNIKGVQNYLVEVYTNDLGTDEVLIRVGSTDHTDAFAKSIKDRFRSRVRVAPNVSFDSVDYIAQMQTPGGSRKVVKFVDLRKKS